MASGSKGKTSKTIVWMILLLVIVGLGGYGTRNFGGNVTSIGNVGDTPIEVNRYARILQQEINAFSAQTGQNMTFSQARQFGLDAAVLARLVSMVALENEASELGLSVGDEAVRNQVVGIAGFQGLDGKFDRQSYKFALEQAGLSEAQFEEDLRAEISRTMVQGAVTAGVHTSDVFTDAILNYAAERRSFAWTALRAEDLARPIPDPTDAELRAYYDANPDRYMLPETRAVTYAWLTPDMIADQVEIDENALRALYQENIDAYTRPERRLVERLVFGTGPEAAAALRDIQSEDTTFEDLAAARNLTLTDIDLGDVTKAELGVAGDAVFGLTEPGIAGPVETDLGPALFRMNGILAAQETSFETARAALLEEYRLDRARRVVGDQAENIDDLLAGGATLEELADETDMRLGTIGWTTASNQGIASDPAFGSAAAETETGDFPHVSQLEDGGIFALRVDKVVASHVQDYQDALQQVTGDWRRSETTKALVAQARTLTDQLKIGVGAADLGLVLTEVTDVTRNGSVPDTPGNFVDEVFRMNTGDYRVIEGESASYLVRLGTIDPPDTEDANIAAQGAAFAQSTTQGIASDLLAAYTRAIQARAGISLNQAAINAVHSQFH